MSHLLARYADAIFWMARYMERAENLARILEVHETFARDDRGATNWRSILQLHDDENAYRARYPEITASDVVYFYVLDARNTTSIISAVRAARENARVLRPWISTEMWSQINVFHNRLQEMGPRDLTPHNLAKLCALVKESCQAHTGITEGTFYRDQGWYFYQLAKYIERADQTTRLLDINYHSLLPSSGGAGSALDMAQWGAVLRSAAAYHAFRRLCPRGMTPAAVAGFLLFNDGFPRSVAVCVRHIDSLLHQIKSTYMLRGGNGAMERIDVIKASLARPIENVIHGGLHDYLDWLQCRLCDVTGEISRAFFSQHAPAPQTQAQHTQAAAGTA